MLDITPVTVVTIPAFRDKAMNVRIPFKIPAECMENHDKAGSKVKRMIKVIE